MHRLSKYLLFMALVIIINIIILTHARADGFSIYSITLNTPIEEIIKIAHNNDFKIYGTGPLQKEYNLELPMRRSNDSFNAIVNLLRNNKYFQKRLDQKSYEANFRFQQQIKNNSASILDRDYLGEIWIDINNNANNTNYIQLYFYNLQDKNMMVDISIDTQDMNFLHKLGKYFSGRYGKPIFIPYNHPDGQRPFSGNKPVTEYDEYIWKSGNEVCKLKIKWSNESGVLQIYNEKVLKELVNIVEANSDKAMEGKLSLPHPRTPVEVPLNNFSDFDPNPLPKQFQDYPGINEDQIFLAADGKLRKTWEILKIKWPPARLNELIDLQQKWIDYENSDIYKFFQSYREDVDYRAHILSVHLFKTPKSGIYKNEFGEFSLNITDNQIHIKGIASDEKGQTCTFEGKGWLQDGGWSQIEHQPLNAFYLLPLKNGIEVFYPLGSNQGCELNVSFDGFYNLDDSVHNNVIDEFKDR